MRSGQQTVDNRQTTHYPMTTIHGTRMRRIANPLPKSGGKTLVMGILNVTPDSFYDGGRYLKVKDAVRRGLKMIDEGAGLVDIGGVSTRPGSETIPLEEELKRVIPVVKELASLTEIPLSVDTYRASVAEKALEAGAAMVNDISGLSDKDMTRVAASHGATLVIMHIRGKPHRYPKNPVYHNIIAEVSSFLERRVEMALKMGVKSSNIIIDPGLGFGKTASQSLELLRRLGELRVLGQPIMVGPSRKSFIGKILGGDAGDRLPGTLAVIALAILQGASIIRVHDVKEAVQVASLCSAFKGLS
ncbi:MAG TPA: dihydropteroate synthase [Candidatus Tripitaka californicus]